MQPMQPLVRAGVPGPRDPENWIHARAMCRGVPRLRPIPYRVRVARDTNHDFLAYQKTHGALPSE
jgi:hypothetical protein